MAQFVLTAQLALQAPGNTKQVISQIRQQLQGINVNVNLKANTSQLNNVNTQLSQTSKNAKAAEKSVSELARSLGSAARRFGVIAIATGTFLGLSRAIKSSLGDAIEFERQLVNLSQVTGKSVKSLQDISTEITRISTNFGVSSDQLLKTSVVLAQAGLEARKVKAALQVLAQTELASSFDNITNTTEGAIAILSQFKREAVAAGGDIAYLEQSLGAINDVSKKFAVESADLVAVIRRSGGAFEAAGGSLNELLALFTSVRATTRESAETIATGLRTIFTRIQRVDTIQQLQELGISLQDSQGKFVGAFEAFKRISQGLSSIDPRDFRFAAIVEELGGFRQIGKVIPLIKQFSVAQNALNVAQSASGSLAKDAEIAQLSLANQIAKVREEFQALTREFFDSATFYTISRGALELAKAFIRIADSLQPLLPLIASLAAFQIGKGFIPALSGFTGLNRKNAGGRIQKFATGGFVPGSGNRDTVPAMLTPGEFVIRKHSAKKIGAEKLQNLNRGGNVKNLLSTKGSLKSRYDVGDTKEKINDKYSPVNIMRERLDLDYKSSREEAEDIFNQAKIIRDRNLEKYKDPRKALKKANKFIRSKTDGLSQPLGDEFNNVTNRSYNKIAGALAEKKTNELYRKAGADLERIPDVDGADFYNPDSKEYIEVKNKTAKTSDKELIAKALLAESRDDRRKYKNKLPDTISGMKIRLLTTNKKDIAKKNLGGVIQKFAGGGIVDVLTGKESVAALLMADYSPGQTTIPMSYPAGFESAVLNSSPAKIQGNELAKSIKLDQFGLNKSAGSNFGAQLRENLTNSAAAAINQTVSQMAPMFSTLGIQADFKNLVPAAKTKSAISGGVIGTLFESIIDNLSNQSKDVKDSSFFDFVGPLSDNATKLFEKSESVNNSTYKDAKLNVKLKNIQSKIINQASQELGISNDIKSTGQILTANDYVKRLTDANLFEEFKTTGLSVNKLASVNIKGRDKDVVLSMLQDKFGVDRIAYEDKQLNQIDPKTGQPRIGRTFFLKYAKGGTAFSDKTPALLTPGEFVVNRASAQEIGYTNLNRMNKTGKIPGYANGGIVGAKKFAVGGPVNPSLSSPSGKAVGFSKFEAVFKNLAQNAQGTNTTLEILKKALKEYKNQYGPLTKSLAQHIKAELQLAKQLEASQKQQISFYNNSQKLSQSFSNIFSKAQNFVFLTSSIAAITSQFSSLDEATNSAITTTSVFASTMIGTIGTLGDFSQTLLSLLPVAAQAKVMNMAFKGLAIAASALAIPVGALGAGIVAVVAVIGGVALYFYYLQQRANSLADAMEVSADKILQSAIKGEGGTEQQFVNKQLEALAQRQSQYWLVSEKGMRDEIEARRQVATSIYRLAVEAKQTENALASISKSGATEVQKTAMTSNVLFSQILKNISESSKLRKQQKTIAENPTMSTQQKEDNLKIIETNLDNATERFVALSQQINQNIEKNLEENLKKIEITALGKSGEEIFNNLLKNSSTGLAQILTQYQDAIRADTRSKIDQLINSSKNEQELAQNRQRANEIIRQSEGTIYDMNQALKNQLEAERKKLESIDAINKSLEAQRINMAQANESVKLFARVIDNVNQYSLALESSMAAISGAISKVSNTEIVGIQNLNEIIDPDQFRKQINRAVVPLGDFGNVVASNLTNTSQVLDRARKRLVNVRFGQANIIEVINDLFSGVNLNEDLKSAISNSIKDAIQASSEQGSLVTASEFENIFAPLLAQSEPYRKAVEGIVNSNKALLDANVAYLNEFNQLRQQEVDIRKKLVDITNRSAERLAQARDKELTTRQKEQQRNLRRGFSAQNRSGLLQQFYALSNSIRTLDSQIKSSQDINTTAQLQRQQANLILSFSNLKTVIEELADQSELAADVLGDIEKERQRRQAKAKIAEDFVVGGRQERMDINRQFRAAGIAMATGSLQLLKPEDRKAAVALFDQFSEIDDSFKNIKQTLVYFDALRSGNQNLIAFAEAGLRPTTKEDKLIAELNRISAEEMAFQKILLEQNRVDQQGIAELYKGLNTNIQNFPQAIQQSLNNAAQESYRQQLQLEENRRQNELFLRQQAQQEEAKRLEEQKKRDAAIAEQEQAFVTQLTRLTNAVIAGFREAARIKAEEEQRAKSVERGKQLSGLPTLRAQGGPVYRAAGGSIFEPRGTDTVPAMLTPGEFVMRKSAVDKYGTDFMQSINSGSYANKGGSVNKFGVSYLQEGGIAETVLDTILAGMLNAAPSGIILAALQSLFPDEMKKLFKRSKGEPKGEPKKLPRKLTPAEKAKIDTSKITTTGDGSKVATGERNPSLPEKMVRDTISDLNKNNIKGSGRKIPNEILQKSLTVSQQPKVSKISTDIETIIPKKGQFALFNELAETTRSQAAGSGKKLSQKQIGQIYEYLRAEDLFFSKSPIKNYIKFPINDLSKVLGFDIRSGYEQDLAKAISNQGKALSEPSKVKPYGGWIDDLLNDAAAKLGPIQAPKGKSGLNKLFDLGKSGLKFGGPGFSIATGLIDIFTEFDAQGKRLERQGKTRDDITTQQSAQAVARGIIKTGDPTGLPALADWLQSKVTGRRIGIDNGTMETALEASREYENVIDQANARKFQNTYRAQQTDYAQVSPQQASLNLLDSLNNEKRIIDSVKSLDLDNLAIQTDKLGVPRLSEARAKAQAAIEKLKAIPGLDSSSYSGLIGSLTDYVQNISELEKYDKSGNRILAGDKGPETAFGMYAEGITDNALTNRLSGLLGMGTKTDTLNAKAAESLRLFEQQKAAITGAGTASFGPPTKRESISSKIDSQLKKESEIYDMNYKVSPVFYDEKGKLLSFPSIAKDEESITLQQWMAEKQRIEQEAKTKKEAEKLEKDKAFATTLGKTIEEYNAQTGADKYLPKDFVERRDKKPATGGAVEDFMDLPKDFRERFWKNNYKRQNQGKRPYSEKDAVAFYNKKYATTEQQTGKQALKFNKGGIVPGVQYKQIGGRIGFLGAPNRARMNIHPWGQGIVGGMMANQRNMMGMMNAQNMQAMGMMQGAAMGQLNMMNAANNAVRAGALNHSPFSRVDMLAAFGPNSEQFINPMAVNGLANIDMANLDAAGRFKIKSAYLIQEILKKFEPAYWYKKGWSSKGGAKGKSDFYKSQIGPYLDFLRNPAGGFQSPNEAQISSFWRLGDWIDDFQANMARNNQNPTPKEIIQQKQKWWESAEKFIGEQSKFQEHVFWKGFARGGLVYASNGQLVPNMNNALYRNVGGSIFEPRGTDTVPAMLTPGEFVIQRSAVQKYGVDTMQAINSGSAPSGFNQGGIVYRQNGGSIRNALTNISMDRNAPPQINIEPLIRLQQTFDELNSVLNGMNIKHEVSVDGSLNVFGIDNDSIVTAIQDGIANYVVGKVTETIRNAFRI